jgi:hypothetical protein
MELSRLVYVEKQKKPTRRARWAVRVGAGEEHGKKRRAKVITRLDGELERVQFLDHQGVLNVLLALDELLVLHILCHLFHVLYGWLLAF